jgi:hypothetical protein
MIELVWMVEQKRMALRTSVLRRDALGGYRLGAMAGVVLIASLATFLFPPAAFMGLAGFVTVAELTFLGVVLLISVVASPVALILF